jgi:hypothetical protein
VECGSDLRRSIARRLLLASGNSLAFGTTIRHSWLFLSSGAVVAATAYCKCFFVRTDGAA